MKKHLAIILVAILCMCASFVYAEETAFTVRVDSKTAAPGESVELNINLENNSGILAMLFELNYDADKLKLTDVKDGNLVAGAVFGKEYDKVPYKMLWNSASKTDFTDDGVLVTVVFQVREDAQSGTAEVSLTYNPRNLYNVKLEDVEVSVINGGIDIASADEENNPSDEPETPEASEPSETPETPQEPDTPSDSEDSDEGGDSGNGNSGNGNSGSGSHSGGGSHVVKPSKKPDAAEQPKTKETEDVTTEPEEDADKEEAPAVVCSFSDVSEDDWFYESVNYVQSLNLMKGVNDTAFAPDENLTRAMLVTIIYRLDGEPESGKADFSDVEESSWYYESVAWAAGNDIVKGVGGNMFAPDENITREQIALILYNYAKLKGEDTEASDDIDAYADLETVSDWAYDAVKWAISRGFIRGKTEDTLDSSGNATRAEAATILMRYIEKQ